jgi:hypothetical protein
MSAGRHKTTSDDSVKPESVTPLASARRTYTATFADGRSETRCGIRPFTHAYRIQAGGRMGTTGFATTLERCKAASRGDNTRYYEGAGEVEIVNVVQS